MVTRSNCTLVFSSAVANIGHANVVEAKEQSRVVSLNERTATEMVLT